MYAWRWGVETVEIWLLDREDAVLSGRGVYFLSFERGLEGVAENVVDMGGEWRIMRWEPG